MSPERQNLVAQLLVKYLFSSRTSNSMLDFELVDLQTKPYMEKPAIIIISPTFTVQVSVDFCYNKLIWTCKIILLRQNFGTRKNYFLITGDCYYGVLHIFMSTIQGLFSVKMKQFDFYMYIARIPHRL